MLELCIETLLKLNDLVLCTNLFVCLFWLFEYFTAIGNSLSQDIWQTSRSSCFPTDQNVEIFSFKKTCTTMPLKKSFASFNMFHLIESDPNNSLYFTGNLI